MLFQSACGRLGTAVVREEQPTLEKERWPVAGLIVAAPCVELRLEADWSRSRRPRDRQSSSTVTGLIVPAQADVERAREPSFQSSARQRV